MTDLRGTVDHVRVKFCLHFDADVHTLYTQLARTNRGCAVQRTCLLDFGAHPSTHEDG